jgi:hypothetical protein
MTPPIPRFVRAAGKPGVDKTWNTYERLNWKGTSVQARLPPKKYQNWILTHQSLQGVILVLDKQPLGRVEWAGLLADNNSQGYFLAGTDIHREAPGLFSSHGYSPARTFVPFRPQTQEI